MKLTDYAGWLVSILQDDQTTATELLRALREQSRHFDPEQMPVETVLGPDILRAKSGPRGGLNADPCRSALVLIAVLLDGRRSDIGLRVWRAWHLSHKGSRSSPNMPGDWEPAIIRCTLTKQHLFGDALKVLLGHENIAKSVKKVRVGGDHFAEIWHSKDQVSRFGKNIAQRYPPPLLRVAELDGIIVKRIAALLSRLTLADCQ